MLPKKPTLDAYTRQPMRTPTMEHVVPNFLGGSWEAPILDKTSNDGFGLTIDQALHRALSPIILMLDARTHRDPTKQARLLDNLCGSDGRTYRMHPGGQYSPRRDLRLTDLEDGIRVEGEGAFEFNEIVEAVARRAQRRGLDYDKIRAKAVSEIKLQPFMSSDSTVTVPFDLWTDATQRATAKLACNLLAANDPDLFGEPAFDEIRAFVRDGEWSSTGSPVESAPSGWSVGGRDFDHLVVVKTNETTGVVYGVVSYFGGLSFLVRLSRVSIGRNLALSYRVNQLDRTSRRDHADDLAMDLPDFDAAAARPFEDLMEATRAQLEAVMRRAGSRSEYRREVDRITREEFTRGLAGRPQLDPAVPEEKVAIDEIFRRIAHRLAMYLADSGRIKTPDRAPPDADDE